MDEMAAAEPVPAEPRPMEVEKDQVAKEEDPPGEAKEALVAVEPLVKQEVKKEERARAVKKDMVPLFIQERGHGRDGELLRDFILRREHLREDPRHLAVDRWLIRGEFYDECLEEYVKQYGGGEVEVVDLEERAQDLAEACKDIMVVAKVNKKKVDELEVVSKSDDVYALRDTLLAAIKDLTTPRRKLGVASKKLMDDECKEQLKKREQARLRQVVLDCLKGIWESGAGGEVLKIALDAVKSRIDRFKKKSGGEADLIEAMAGHQWAQLEDLVQSIEEQEKGGAARQNLGPIEGRRTKLVIERALEDLGGKGTSRQVIEWIEQHPAELENIREAKLNWHVRDGHRKPVWHSTVSSSMHYFRKISKQGQPTLYLAPKADAPEVPAIKDAAPTPKRPRKRPAEKADAAEAADAADAANAEAPEAKAKAKRSRKAKAKPPALPPADPEAPPPEAPPPEAPPAAQPRLAQPAKSAPERARSPPRKADPLSLALDAALEAAGRAQ